MQPFAIIYLLNKVGKSFIYVFQGSVFPKINFSRFQSFDKTFGLSIVVWVSFPSHADLEVMEQQGIDVIMGGVLNSLIRVMDNPGGGFRF